MPTSIDDRVLARLSTEWQTHANSAEHLYAFVSSSSTTGIACALNNAEGRLQLWRWFATSIILPLFSTNSPPAPSLAIWHRTALHCSRVIAAAAGFDSLTPAHCMVSILAFRLGNPAAAAKLIANTIPALDFSLPPALTAVVVAAYLLSAARNSLLLREYEQAQRFVGLYATLWPLAPALAGQAGLLPPVLLPDEDMLGAAVVAAVGAGSRTIAPGEDAVATGHLLAATATILSLLVCPVPATLPAASATLGSSPSPAAAPSRPTPGLGEGSAHPAPPALCAGLAAPRAPPAPSASAPAVSAAATPSPYAGGSLCSALISPPLIPALYSPNSLIVGGAGASIAKAVDAAASTAPLNKSSFLEIVSVVGCAANTSAGGAGAGAGAARGTDEYELSRIASHSSPHFGPTEPKTASMCIPSNIHLQQTLLLQRQMHTMVQEGLKKSSRGNTNRGHEFDDYLNWEGTKQAQAAAYAAAITSPVAGRKASRKKTTGVVCADLRCGGLSFVAASNAMTPLAPTCAPVLASACGEDMADIDGPAASVDTAAPISATLAASLAAVAAAAITAAFPLGPRAVAAVLTTPLAETDAAAAVATAAACSGAGAGAACAGAAGAAGAGAAAGVGARAAAGTAAGAGAAGTASLSRDNSSSSIAVTSANGDAADKRNSEGGKGSKRTADWGAEPSYAGETRKFGPAPKLVPALDAAAAALFARPLAAAAAAIAERAEDEDDGGEVAEQASHQSISGRAMDDTDDDSASAFAPGPHGSLTVGYVLQKYLSFPSSLLSDLAASSLRPAVSMLPQRLSSVPLAAVGTGLFTPADLLPVQGALVDSLHCDQQDQCVGVPDPSSTSALAAFLLSRTDLWQGPSRPPTANVDAETGKLEFYTPAVARSSSSNSPNITGFVDASLSASALIEGPLHQSSSGSLSTYSLLCGHRLRLALLLLRRSRATVVAAAAHWERVRARWRHEAAALVTVGTGAAALRELSAMRTDMAAVRAAFCPDEAPASSLGGGGRSLGGFGGSRGARAHGPGRHRS